VRRRERRRPNVTRWYPKEWRDRYGDELEALVEDQLAGRRPPLRLQVGLARAGLREHAEALGLSGGGAPPMAQACAGVLVVLAGWAAVVVAGSSFAKLAEHYAAAIPAGERTVPVAAFDAVVAAALAAAALCVLGVAVAMPAFRRFVAGGGWRQLVGPVGLASAATVVAGGGVAGLAPWAHSLTVAQRNGGDGLFSAAFVAVALVGVAALVLWTRAGSIAFLRLELSRRAVGVESALATGVALAMAVVTAGVALWWGSVAVHAPWFLDGAQPHHPGSPANPQLAGSMALMVAGLAVAAYGTVRIGRAWAAVGRSHPA
jgi:hypothetical protein